MYAELIERLTRLKARIKILRRCAPRRRRGQAVRALEDKMAQPGFWESSEKAQEVISEVKRLKKQLDPVREIGSTVSTSTSWPRCPTTRAKHRASRS
jgi:hypothetical protein